MLQLTQVSSVLDYYNAIIARREADQLAATASAGLHPVPDDALQIDTLARWCDQAGADALHFERLVKPPACRRICRCGAARCGAA